MSIFSLNWFKSKKRKELDDLQLEEQRIKNELLRKQLHPEEPLSVGKPYRKLKLVNDVLTVVLNDGSVISKPSATAEDFTGVRTAVNEAQIMLLISSPEVLEERKKAQSEAQRMFDLQQGINLLGSLDDFTVEGNTIYLKGIHRTLPQLLVEKFMVIAQRCGGNQIVLDQDNEYQSLKRFFMWCCLNPRAEVADKLYGFLQKNSFKITSQGFFVALRNVVTLHGSTELVQFVSNVYNKVKAVWKKSPEDYDVFLKDDVYSIVHHDDQYTTEFVECDCYDEEEWYGCDECDNGQREITVRKNLGVLVGSLTELYLDLPNRSENRFTDAHTKTFDIRIGKPVNMSPDACRWNTDDCGAEGLHFTADEIHYVGCGDQSVLVLINPMKVVGIGESKGRCWEYLPIMTVPREEATELLKDLEFDTLELDDSYAIRELEGLTEKAKEGFVAESKKHEFNMPHISSREIENIVLSLDEMKSRISARIKTI
jgi:hypothetical protein